MVGGITTAGHATRGKDVVNRTPRSGNGGEGNQTLGCGDRKTRREGNGQSNKNYSESCEKTNPEEKKINSRAERLWEFT